MSRRAVPALVLALGLGALAGGVPTTLSVLHAAPAQAAAPPPVAAVQSLYAQDLVARINAERGARDSGAVPVPQLQVDPGLEAAAQAWSAHLAAMGTVADPPLGGCTGDPTQICAFAANSGDSGDGFWPGDGSDGMAADYMGSAGHRQNELGAAYEYVGVGVTCSANQAWTVELFGYAYGDYPSANARQVSQDSTQGDPVPATPMVAGTQTGDPVYCPGQTIGPNGQVTATGGQYPYPYAVAGVPGEPNGDAPAPVVGMAATPDGKGYWLARADGSVSAHGDAVNDGSMAGTPLNAPVAHIVSTPDGKGYWLVASDGGIFSFGDATFYGSMGGHPLDAPVVGIAPTPDGGGYWLVASDGGIFSFGDATFYGSMGGHPLNAPVVGMAADHATGGYWLVGSDGGIFSFNAPFDGSTGSLRLDQPVNGMAATPDGGGYWFVASDGGIFSFGDARFAGSTGGMALDAPVVGMAGDGSDDGYWLVGADGGVFSFGAPFYGAG
ncbi:MAG: CAP domain-containing protein [Acidimicrobiales bacterium]